MYHEMKLNDKAFQLIKDNIKTIELRLNDEKRKKIKEYDLIGFTNLKTFKKQYVQVVKLYHYNNFKDLYNDLDLIKCGYKSTNKKTISHEDMLKYYSEFDQQKYGVLGIEIETLTVLSKPVNKINESLTDNEITLKLNKISKEDEQRGYVKAYKYDIYLYNTNIKIGFIDLRLGYNENIIYGGNIGYMINEEYRGNNYAKKASLLILEVAKAFKMKKVFISCSPKNIASKKTIESLGFKFLRKIKLPLYNEMYLLGDKEKLIYELAL